MNIDDYRALKAQESAQATQSETKPETKPETTPTQPVATATPENPVVPEIKPPEKVAIDGIGEVTLDELKNGYLRQADYTKKTQEVVRQRKEAEQAISIVEQLKQNPQALQQLSQVTQIPANLDPTTAKVTELENRLYDMMLQTEVDKLQQKYPDFEIRDVLTVAQENNLTNLEHAYFIAKSQKPQTQAQTQVPSVDTLKEQIRQDLIKELKAEGTATSTLITSNSGAPITSDNSPQISLAEHNVAQKMRMSDADFIKWRDIGKKK